jgi:hypothetical protein
VTGSQPGKPQANREPEGLTPDDAGQRRQRLNQRLRTERIAGAEEEWRRRSGRPMTAAELERVLRRHPGDV